MPRGLKKKVTNKPAKSAKGATGVEKSSQVPGTKKRGRPPKPKPKPKPPKQEIKGTEETENKVLKKRGRPPKVTKSTKFTKFAKFAKFANKYNNEPDDYVPPKTYKFLGYCPNRDCGMMIMPFDFETKTIFICPSCGKRYRVTKLKKENSSDKPKAKTKKEFLSTRNLQYESSTECTYE